LEERRKGEVGFYVLFLTRKKQVGELGFFYLLAYKYESGTQKPGGYNVEKQKGLRKHVEKEAAS